MKIVDISDGNGKPKNFSFWREFWPVIPIAGLITFLIMATMLAQINQMNSFEKWRDTATCDELKTYAIKNIDDKGTNSGISFMGSDIPGDQYDTVITLISLKCGEK